VKKIKRTITVRKVEFFSHQTNQHDSNIEVCPFCKSLLIPQLPPKDSAIEISGAESSPEIEGESKKEK
jgi:hypothetical protein